MLWSELVAGHHRRCIFREQLVGSSHELQPRRWLLFLSHFLHRRVQLHVHERLGADDCACLSSFPVNSCALARTHCRACQIGTSQALTIPLNVAGSVTVLGAAINARIYEVSTCTVIRYVEASPAACACVSFALLCVCPVRQSRNFSPSVKFYCFSPVAFLLLAFFAFMWHFLHFTVTSILVRCCIIRSCAVPLLHQ